MALYNQNKLSEGKYLNFYDICFDKPECHVISKDGALYYAFYAEKWNGKPIELRGLEAERKYIVTEYTSDDARQFEIDGKNPVIRPAFKDNYLIQVIPE